MSGPAHTYGDDCLHCGDGTPGTCCDLFGYTVRRVRFIQAHREAFETAYLNHGHAAAGDELARLAREYGTLPPRHSCSCRKINRRTGVYEWDCYRCRRLEDQRPKGPDMAAIDRTSPVNAPTPSALMLDLERALVVLGNDSDAHALAGYMSLNAMRSSVEVDQPRSSAVTIEHELVCLMCSRPAFTGQQQCRWCGGCLVMVTVA